MILGSNTMGKKRSEHIFVKSVWNGVRHRQKINPRKVFSLDFVAQSPLDHVQCHFQLHSPACSLSSAAQGFLCYVSHVQAPGGELDTENAYSIYVVMVDPNHHRCHRHPNHALPGPITLDNSHFQNSGFWGVKFHGIFTLNNGLSR